MKCLKYRGDKTDQFRLGQVLGRRTDGDAFIKVISIDYDEANDRTIITGEHITVAAPDGMRIRYQGNATEQEHT